MEKIRSVVDKRIFSCCVYFDLQKAFDTVNDCILLDKLDYYRIQSMPKMWLKSFPRERNQFTNNIKDKVLVNDQLHTVSHKGKSKTSTILLI